MTPQTDKPEVIDLSINSKPDQTFSIAKEEMKENVKEMSFKNNESEKLNEGVKNVTGSTLTALSSKKLQKSSIIMVAPPTVQYSRSSIFAAPAAEETATKDEKFIIPKNEVYNASYQVDLDRMFEDLSI